MTAIPHPIDEPPSTAIAIALPKELQHYARSTVRWRVGCEVTVLRDGGQTYPAMLAAITSAKRSICFETYILAGDHTGDRFKLALVERARAGVTVRMMYDAVGSFGLAASWLTELRTAGVQIVEFNPIAPWRWRSRLSHRDHRKLLVIDDEVAFTGGLNIADDYAATKDGGAGWHDMHCRVRGPIVLDLARLFRRTWLRAGGDPYPASPPVGDAIGLAGKSFVRAIDNTARRKKPAIRRAYTYVIKAARESVMIQNAYFVPDRGLRRALVRAVRRGVDVRVIVPGKYIDSPNVRNASRFHYGELLDGGVQIFEYRPTMMHNKVMIVDGIWTSIGSINFVNRSMKKNGEANVSIYDRRFAERAEATVEADLIQSERFTKEKWKKRGLLARFGELFFWLFSENY